jgi:hypothetical protein
MLFICKFLKREGGVRGIDIHWDVLIVQVSTRCVVLALPGLVCVGVM